MRIEELRDLTRSELEDKKRDLSEERFNLTMRKSFKELDNPLRLRYLRRDIARINTLLQEDEVGSRKLAHSKTSILSDMDSTGTDAK